MNKRTWKPVTAAEYDRELVETCREIEQLRDAVRAVFADRGTTSAAPRLAAELRELRAAVAALRAGPGLDR